MKSNRLDNIGRMGNRVWDAICVKCTIRLYETQDKLNITGEPNDKNFGIHAVDVCCYCGTEVLFFPTNEFEN